MAGQVVTQVHERYQPVDHRVWSTLYRQQLALVPAAAPPQYLDGLARLPLPLDRVPDLDDVNGGMADVSDWTFVAVDGLFDGPSFFALLDSHRFPVTVTMRGPDEVAFAELPDLFHDLFGHGPYLANPTTAALYHAFGTVGMRHADEPDFLDRLHKVLWTTLEVGLVRSGGGLRAFGGAILSSAAEIENSMGPRSPVEPFVLDAVLAAELHILKLQTRYFVVDDFNEVWAALESLEADR